MAASSSNASLIAIDRFFHPTDAHIAAGRLESVGIPVFLLGINHATANWLMSIALGGIRLQVPANRTDEARSILAESFEPDSEENMVCPRCGGANTTAISNDWKLSFLAIHLLNLPLPWRKGRRHCLACEAEWSEQDAT